MVVFTLVIYIIHINVHVKCNEHPLLRIEEE